MYYTYMLRCKDDSLYTGIASDIERRMMEHFTKGKKCAKYTLNHEAKVLECVWQSENRILASKLEFHIKTLKKKDKEKLILDDSMLELLKAKVDINSYKRIDIKNIKRKENKI